MRDRVDVETDGTTRTGGRGRDARGTALIEFALLLPVLILLSMAVIDFGNLFQTRLILSNVSREGASVGSRQTTLDSTLTLLMLASGHPLALSGPDGRIVVTRLVAGRSADASAPTIERQLAVVSLARGSRIDAADATLGLSPNLYNHLVYRAVNGSADISELTVVEVYYKYRPITPLPRSLEGFVPSGQDGIVIGSKAVF